MIRVRPRRRGRAIMALVAGALLVSIATVVPATSASAAASVTDAWTNKARYSPGQQAIVTAQVSGTGPVVFNLTHLGNVVTSGTVQANGSSQVSWTVTPPSTDFTGYMVEILAGTTKTQTAIDVSSNWTRFPRMGYLDSYAANMTGAQQQSSVSELSRKYHINALQFYDWMWRHEKPIQRDALGKVVPSWQAWNGDVIAPATVQGLIDVSHATNVAALPYSMSYAALEGFSANGVDANWRLKYRSNGTDWKFEMYPGKQDTTLWIMNPSNSGWKAHITDQYNDQIDTFGFDGTHLDQLGNWGGSADGGMNDLSGNAVDIPQGFADLVATTQVKTGATTGFNAVDGFGGTALAGGNSDYLYSELWENNETFANVQSYLKSQRAASGSKGAVLAAYMNYRNNYGPRFEAEAGTRGGNVQVAGNHPGYSGTGFVDNFGAVGDSVTITVTAPESRRYGIVPAWSNGTGTNATRTVTIDGVVAGQLKLTPTNNWDTWSSEAGFGHYLSAGTHTVKVSYDTGNAGFANLDSISLGTFNTPSVQLANAAFAANGATHVEMGQGDQMLVAPYFLDHSKQMDLQLQGWMKTYYDVITGYENLFYGPTLKSASNQVQVAGQTTSTNGAADTIWTNVMSNNGVDVLHLVNLKGNDDRWREPAAVAPTLSNLPVKFYIGDKPTPPTIKVGSPDRDGGRSTNLSFTSGTDAGGRYVSFTVPQLKNWDFIYMGTPTAGNGNVVGLAGKCLDVAGGNSTNGTAVQIWDCASVPAQQWTYRENQLQAVGKCLGLSQGGTTNGTATQISDCQPGPSQVWERTTKNQYRNLASGKCLDIYQGTVANGSPAHLWDCTTVASQKWTTPQ